MRDSQGVHANPRRSAEERSVLDIARKVAATVGADFFTAIATHLSKALSADCVLIGEFVGGSMEGVRTLGASLDGKPASFAFELAGTAAADVALGKPCICRSDAATRFPQDPFLPSIGAQSVIAEPLQNHHKRAEGLIMVCYRRPMVSFRVIKQVLTIFSDRAAAELRRKRHEEELEQSEQRHRAFIASSADAMWRIELEHSISIDLPEEEQLFQIYNHGYLAECNDALARLYGFEKAEQLIGVKVREIAAESDEAMRQANLLAVRSGYAYTTVEIGPVNRGGVERHILRSQWGIVEEGKLLQRIWGISRDITQLKTSEKRLDASRQRMADLLETMQLVAVIVDPQGLTSFCNKYFYQRTGWNEADIIGKDWIERMIPSEEHGSLREICSHTVAESPTHFDGTLLGPAGQRWQFSWDCTALRDYKGNIAGWANIGRDVTEYHALQIQLAQAQKLATIGGLAGGLAHDFNNLLTVILGYSATLLKDRPETDPAHLGLIEIRKAAGRGAELTKRLLAFGRRQVLLPEVIDLNGLITDAEYMMRHLVGDDVRVAIRLEPSLWKVWLDSSSFHQVLMNLVANARDAMPQGGAITVTTANVKVDVASGPELLLHSGEYVRVTVSDTGTGFAEAAQSHLFEPFFTTKQTRTDLGLSTVYGIVQQSGGQIFVDSKPQVGATIKMYFPRIEGAEPVKKLATAPTAVQTGNETILLVEDRDEVRELVAKLLRPLGYTVLEATGALEALEMAQDQTHAIDLLLTDVAMPDMDGFQLAEQMRVFRDGIKTLFMSGFADDPQLAVRVSQPGCAYLEKPFTPEVLATSVRNILDAK